MQVAVAVLGIDHLPFKIFPPWTIYLMSLLYLTFRGPDYILPSISQDLVYHTAPNQRPNST